MYVCACVIIVQYIKIGYSVWYHKRSCVIDWKEESVKARVPIVFLILVSSVFRQAIYILMKFPINIATG